MFCANCGRQLPEGSKFCAECGAAVQDVARPDAPHFEPPPAYAGSGKVREGIPAPGFSDRENDPEILAYVAKSRSIGKKAGFVVALLPLIGFVIYAAVTGEMEIGQAAVYGAIISAVFLVVQLIAARRERAENNYDGVVTDKKWQYRNRNKSGENNSQETEYIVYVRTSDGKKKKIIEHDGGRVIAYHLLNVGDRFRYHANFPFPYELYDKTKGPGIYCVGCDTLNPIENDRCKRCNLPLLK